LRRDLGEDCEDQQEHDNPFQGIIALRRAAVFHNDAEKEMT
jgi:hypothetical protein